MDKRLESSNRDKVLRQVARRLRGIGLVRTKSTFFTRSGQHVIEFLHVHKFSFAPSFRLHLGVRVISDVFDACELNGPVGSHGFDYGPADDSVAACADRALDYVVTVAEPWFQSWRDLDRLLSAPDTPLGADSLQCLRESLQSGVDPVRARRSHDLLGTAQQAHAAGLDPPT